MARTVLLLHCHPSSVTRPATKFPQRGTSVICSIAAWSVPPGLLTLYIRARAPAVFCLCFLYVFIQSVVPVVVFPKGRSFYHTSICSITQPIASTPDPRQRCLAVPSLGLKLSFAWWMGPSAVISVVYQSSCGAAGSPLLCAPSH